MDIGIVGLPYIGKTTLFNALTGLGIDTVGDQARPNVGMADVPDPRLGILCQHVPTKKVVPATIQLVDIAGIQAGDTDGKGRRNPFLSHVRNVDALIHVVRCFEDPSVPGEVDPVTDVEQVEMELIVSDLEQLEGMVDKAQRQARSGNKEAKARLAVIEVCLQALGEGRPVLAIDDPVLKTPEADEMIRSIALLTAKKSLFVGNVSEDDLAGEGEHASALRGFIEGRGGMVVPVCAKLEAELAELDDAERGEMLEAMGLEEPALNVLARAAYQLLGVHSFFTCGPDENRAWTIPVGALAPAAGHEIHTDIGRGFIRVEVFSIDDLVQYKSEHAIKAAGKLRVEGKHYVVQDGDVCHFLFNV